MPDDLEDPNKNTISFKKRMELIKDTDVDYLRGVDNFDGSSSSDDDTSSDDEEEEAIHDWAELDKDAEWDVDGREVEVRLIWNSEYTNFEYTS